MTVPPKVPSQTIYRNILKIKAHMHWSCDPWYMVTPYTITNVLRVLYEENLFMLTKEIVNKCNKGRGQVRGNQRKEKNNGNECYTEEKGDRMQDRGQAQLVIAFFCASLVT